jgi:hypothetical protein
MAGQLIELAQEAARLLTAAERAQFWLGQEQVLGRLRQFPAMAPALTAALERLENSGVEAAI